MKSGAALVVVVVLSVVALAAAFAAHMQNRRLKTEMASLKLAVSTKEALPPSPAGSEPSPVSLPPGYENEDGPGEGFDPSQIPVDCRPPDQQSAHTDPSSLGGVYEVTLDPNEPERKSMTLRLVFNIQSQNGNSIPFDLSMVDANGTSFHAQTGYAHFNLPSGTMKFMCTCQALFDVYEFEGVLTPVSLEGTYTETIDITGFSGKPTKHPGTFSGQKIF